MIDDESLFNRTCGRTPCHAAAVTWEHIDSGVGYDWVALCTRHAREAADED